MKRAFLCATILLVLGVASLHGQTAPSAAALTVIRAGTLIDGAGAAPRKNQLIFVRGERIEKVTEGSTPIPADAKVIDLSGATVLPGLIDSHTHIFFVGRGSVEGRV